MKIGDLVTICGSAGIILSLRIDSTTYDSTEMAFVYDFKDKYIRTCYTYALKKL